MSTYSKTIIVDFIRHGEPHGGDILRGRVDPELTDLGWSQMQKATGLSSKHIPGDVTPAWSEIISSPLKRCRYFAEQLAAQADLPISVLDYWQEIDYGDWDGMLVSEWRKIAADQFKAFREDISALAPPNGEDFLSFKDRILSAWHKLAAKEDGSHLLVVTHGGVLRVVLPTVLGMPLNRSFPLHIPFACFTRIRLDINEDKASASLILHNGAEHGANAN
ncbi:MAG: histidine phosphatase family protein [Gammaproteobacteria bacterium]|nr:histidine phosphatase family protein [Gammaproteobacteria bacterium]MDD9896823.1 histidine phosphatase family protein [Gammaproteobacteria bacterium]